MKNETDTETEKPIYYISTGFVILAILQYSRVMRVGSDTFGDPIFQKGLQN